MTRKILCVAEKPAIARAVAQHLGGGGVNTVSLVFLWQVIWMADIA